MNHLQLVCAAASAWYDSRIQRVPTYDELAECALRIDPSAERLDVLRACVMIAECLADVMRWRSNASTNAAEFAESHVTVREHKSVRRRS